MDADMAAIEEEANALHEAVSAKPAPHEAAGRTATHRHPSRTGVHDVPLRLEAHRRGRQREAGLPAGRLYGRAPHPRKMGVRALPEVHAGARARVGHRQGYPDGGTFGAGAGRQVRRPPADIPPGRHLYSLRPGADALDAGRVSRRVRAAVATAGCRSAGQIRATCRRDASADAQAGRGSASMNNHASHCCSSDRQPLACSIFDYDDWPVDVAADGDVRLFQVYPARHRKPLHLARALAALAVAGADR